jgi:endo-1,4-beta-xylanase
MKIKFITLLLFVSILCGFSNCGALKGSASAKQGQLPALKDVYKDYFPIGNILNGRYLTGEYLEILTTQFNTVTAENQMKPDNLAPREKGGQYNFGPADRMVNEILEYGITVHGHTLVWHKQTPAWMTTGTPAQVKENMVNYINTVLAHYKGKVISWDVVNEGIRERINPGDQDLNWKTQLHEDSKWFIALGADYIELAFRTARAADPDIELYFNDYNLDNQRKVQVMVNMIKDINDRYKAEGHTRNLIDGVGMQAHYGTSTSSVNVRNSIQKFKDIGIKIAISELDVEIKSVGSGSFGAGKNSTTSEVEQRIQAITYAELFNVFKENKDHITRVTMWGIEDEFSWKSLGNPCLWDGELKPKQAFWAVVDPKKTLRL